MANYFATLLAYSTLHGEVWCSAATFCLRNVIVRGQCLPSVYPHVMLKPAESPTHNYFTRMCTRNTWVPRLTGDGLQALYAHAQYNKHLHMNPAEGFAL